DGSVVKPPLFIGASAATVTDRNGNKITVDTSGHFYDTLSSTTPTLTVAGSGTPSSPQTFTYTPPSASNVAYVMHYTAKNIKTNFGCSGITEYTGSNISLVTDITLPDNSQYLFTYEPTPGFSGYVTGRIASITLPTGGTINYTYTGGSSGHITCADGSNAGLTRQTPDGTWNYARTAGSGAA